MSALDAQRRTVTFDSGGVRCAATLFLPREQMGVVPGIVLGHGLGGTQDMRLDAYAERFAGAGYAAMTFDYRCFGLSGGRPRQLLDIETQLDDWAAAVDTARTQPEIDPDRIVLFGTSFGGGHVVVTAARDERIAGVIAQCPFTDGLASARTRDARTAVRLSLLAARDDVARLLRREPVYVPTSGPPGTPALMNAPDAHESYLALVPSGSTFRNEVAARFATRILWYRPGRSAKDIRCPILFSVCLTDSVAPAKQTLAYARQAPRAEVVEYPFGHFDIYRGRPFEQAITDQMGFLGRHVPVSTRSADSFADRTSAPAALLLR